MAEGAIKKVRTKAKYRRKVEAMDLAREYIADKDITQHEAGARFGLSPKRSEAVLAEARAEMAKTNQEFKAAILERDEALLSHYMPLALDGDKEAAKLVLKINHQQGCITGAYAPVKHEHTTSLTANMDLIREIQQRRQAQGAMTTGGNDSIDVEICQLEARVSSAEGPPGGAAPVAPSDPPFLLGISDVVQQ